MSTNVVTPEYFATFGIGLVRGRDFTPQDQRNAPRVALVSDAMARFFFGESDPIGRTFRLGGAAGRRRGRLSGSFRMSGRSVCGQMPPTRMVYTPLMQAPRGPDARSDTLSRLTVEIRTGGAVAALSALAASVRDEARAVSKDAVVSYVRTMDEQLDASLIRERVLATLSTAFSALALVLSAVGLYGVMAYTVARRSREIGIKLALGAARTSVLLQVLRDTLAVSAAGIAVGCSRPSSWRKASPRSCSVSRRAIR